MKKLMLLERPLYQPTYRIEQKADQFTSPYGRFGLLRDAPSTSNSSWESFDADSLPTYFTKGMNLLRVQLTQFEDLTQSYSAENEKSLAFMIESLIHARGLIEEIHTPVVKERAR